MHDAIVLLRPGFDFPSDSARKRCAEPLLNFARSLGKTSVLAADISSASPAVFWIEEDELRADPIIETLENGDTVIVRTLGTLGLDPVALVAGARMLIGRGVGLYVLSFQGGITSHIEPLAELAAISGDMQKRIDAAELAASRAQTEANSLAFESFREAFFQAMRSGKIPMMHIPQPPDIGEDADVGRYLRRLRTGKGMTQAAVAAAIGCSQSQISALEKDGDGPYLTPLIHYLDPEFTGNPSDRAARKARAAEVLAQPETHGWKPASSTLIATGADGARVEA